MDFDPKVPQGLLELQRWFASVVTHPIREIGRFSIPLYDEKSVRAIEERISPGPQLSSSERIGLYNQQYWRRLFGLLQEKFPGLLRLFGVWGFNVDIAEPYLQKYVPSSWSLLQLGSKLPVWIEEEYKDEDKALVQQMAEIDHAYEYLWHRPLLPLLKEEDLEERLYLQPWIALFELNGDLFTFRQRLVEQEPHYFEENEFPPTNWSNRKRHFILFRDEDRLTYEEIDNPDLFQLLSAFRKGATLLEACSQISDESATEIASWFQSLAVRGWLTGNKV